FQFLKWTKKLLILSAIIIVVGCGLFLWLPNEKLGMDFTGGFEVQIALKEPATQDEIGELVRKEFKTPEVVSIDPKGNKATHFQIKVKSTDLEAETKDAPKDASSSDYANYFAEKVAKLLPGRLIDSGVTDFKLDPPDDKGRVGVAASLKYEAEIKKSDLNTALAKAITVESLDGPDQGTEFKLKGRFTRRP